MLWLCFVYLHQPSMSRIPTTQRQAGGVGVQSQQSHIDELVQENRTLETINKRLKDALNSEQNRAKDSVNGMSGQWQVEKAQFEESIETLHGLHRIAHLKTKALLEAEKMRVLKVQGGVRKEKIRVMEREVRISELEAKEEEWKAKLEELREDVEDAKMDGETVLQETIEQYQRVLEKMKEKCAAFAEETKQKSKELDRVVKEGSKYEVCARPL